LTAKTITELYLYPIKSLGGISVPSAEVLTEGFQYDRRWMLVDAEGQFLTQREHAKMALFSCEISEHELIIKFQDEEQAIPLASHTENVSRVKVWSSKLKAHQVSPQISEWFSDHLGMYADLVKLTDISKRPKRLFVPPYKTNLSFADGYPYLILGAASMQTLNEKLEHPLNMDRFRANIIVETSEAHEEDEWKEDFQAGTATLKVIKPCARCVVTTIDQQTGVAGKEPLKTLTTYRKWRNKIWFGANAICLTEGKLKVGDSIQLNSKLS